MFCVGFKKAALGVMLSVSFVSSSFALEGGQAESFKDVNDIAYGVALFKYCPLKKGEDHIRFTTKLMKAERLVKFEHGGVYKLAKSKQEIKAWKDTKAATQCGETEFNKILETESLMEKFEKNSVLNEEMKKNHPKNPKPYQALIFASFLQAKHAWIIERECKALPEQERAKLNRLMKETQYYLEHNVFRPDQLAGLNKRKDERQLRALVKDCEDKSEFARFAISNMETNIPALMGMLHKVLN